MVAIPKFKEGEVTKLEVRGSFPHIFLVTITEDNVRRVQAEYHFYMEGLTVKTKGTREHFLWTSIDLKGARSEKVGSIKIKDVLDCMLANGNYRLFTNNCLHAASRVLCDDVVANAIRSKP